MKASTLLRRLLAMSDAGIDLRKVDVYYRHDYDSDDVYPIIAVEEDLKDESDNDTLTSIVLISKRTN